MEIANPKAFSIFYPEGPKVPEGSNILKAEGLAISIASINRFGKCYYHYVTILNFTK